MVVNCTIPLCWRILLGGDVFTATTAKIANAYTGTSKRNYLTIPSLPDWLGTLGFIRKLHFVWVNLMISLLGVIQSSLQSFQSVSSNLWRGGEVLFICADTSTFCDVSYLRWVVWLILSLILHCIMLLHLSWDEWPLIIEVWLHRVLLCSIHECEINLRHVTWGKLNRPFLVDSNLL